jgi:hypothetical protein
MRASIKALAMLAIGTAQAAVSASSVFAADLGLRTKRHHVRHHHVRVVRDYDGAPIILRRRPDGTTDAIGVPHANPTHYFNGEPVRAGRRILVAD